MAEPVLEVHPLTGAIGAEISGVDLAQLDDEAFTRIHRAFLDHGAIFFRDQKLDPSAQLAFARRFGEPEIHPIVEGTAEHPEVLRVVKPAGQPASFGVGWHSDNSFFEEPSLGSVVFGEVVPPTGGDTLFASMERAWESLSPPLQEMLDGLSAIHSAKRAYDPDVTGREKYEGKATLRYRYSDAVLAEVAHPVVRTHPETGRRCLYVNPMFTQRIEGLGTAESDAILEFLYRHCASPDFQCRFRWRPGSVAVWDNRCVWHYAMNDYQAHERVIVRVTIAGDRPR